MFSVFQIQILPKGGTINVADEEFCTKYKKNITNAIPSIFIDRF